MKRIGILMLFVVAFVSCKKNNIVEEQTGNRVEIETANSQTANQRKENAIRDIQELYPEATVLHVQDINPDSTFINGEIYILTDGMLTIQITMSNSAANFLKGSEIKLSSAEFRAAVEVYFQAPPTETPTYQGIDSETVESLYKTSPLPEKVLIQPIGEDIQPIDSIDEAIEALKELEVNPVETLSR